MKVAGRVSTVWVSLLAIILVASLAALGGAAPNRPAGESNQEAVAGSAAPALDATSPATPEPPAEPATASAEPSGSVIVPTVSVIPALPASGGMLPSPSDEGTTAPVVSEVIDAAETAPLPPYPLPPYDLQGAQAPDPNQLYVVLTWKCDNPPKSIKGYNIYRVADPMDAQILPGLDKPYDTSKKPYYEDHAVEAGHTYRYWVTAVSKKGLESKPSNTVDVYVEKAVVPSQPTGFAAWVVDPGVSLDWNPNPEKDIAGYNVYVSKNPNSPRKKLNGALVTAVHYYVASGKADQCYWVTAVNRIGLESEAAMAVPQAATPVTIEENDPSIQVKGLWVTEGYVGPTNGKIRVAGDAGARLQLSFEGSQVKVVVAKYWSCGSAVVYLDGEKIGVIDLYSETTTYNVIDLSVPGLARGKHTLVIEALGSGNPQHPFNFVNVDCFEVR